MAPTQSSLLILFCRYPVAGKAKTRLIPALGNDGAAALHRALVEHAVSTLGGQDSYALEVHYTGADAAAMRGWLGEQVTIVEQPAGDLGRRMYSAFEGAFARGYQRVAIIGSDAPAISPALITQALDQLTPQLVTFGPATDGGYYLVAAAKAHRALFEHIDWGTERVLQQSQKRAAAAGIKVALLTPLDDIDRPQDLSQLSEFKALKAFARSSE